MNFAAAPFIHFFSQPRNTLGLFAAIAVLGSVAQRDTAQAAPPTAAIVPLGFTTATVTGTSTRGYFFDITSPVTVSGLSFFDNNGDGLMESHDVGLWNSAGTLLASVTVPAGTAAPLDSSGLFRYVALSSSVTLPVATGYVVGGVTAAFSADEVFVHQTGMTMAPGVSYSISAFSTGGSLLLTFPSSVDFASGGISGGSFGVVPEPSTLALLGICCIGSALVRRREPYACSKNRRISV